MNISNETKRKFVKDYNLPIPVVIEPYFSNFLILTEEIYGGLSSYIMLLKEIEEQGGEKEFSSWKYGIAEKIIEDITTSKKWMQEFKDNDPTKNLKKHEINEDVIYKKENFGKKFISIDLKEANFQSLAFISKELVLNAESFRDLLLRYTKSEYLLNSKAFRQYIFVNQKLFPKRQSRIQNHLLSMIVDKLKEKTDENYVSRNQDEIVFEYSKELLSIIEEFKLCCSFSKIKVEVFSLESGHEKRTIFIKKHLSGKIEIKKVDKSLIPEVLRNIKGQCPVKMDRAFIKDGRIALYEDPLYDK